MGLREELDGVNARWADAIARGDARAAARAFTHDGMVIVADTPNTRGQAALEALFRSWIDSGMAKERYGDSQAETIGEGALLTCAFEAEIRDGDGNAQIERGKNLQIFKRDHNGDWKIRVLGITTDTA